MNSNATLVRSRAQTHALAWFIQNPKALIVILFFAVIFCTGTVFSQTTPPGIEEEIEGELEILHEDNDQGGRYNYFINAAGRRLTLQFTDVAPTHLSTGTRIRVRGARSNNVLALKPGSGGVETVASAEMNTLGEQRTLVVLVNFKNDTSQPYTVNFAHEMFFNTTNNFFLENSYQQTFLTGVIKGWYTIDMDRPVNAATCDYSRIASLAEQAVTNEGIIVSDYHHKVYAFPQTACGWWGLSTIGGSPSQSWVNGNLELPVSAHELGHGLGLYHSHALDCGKVTVAANCAAIEYGDVFDMMGGSNDAGDFNAFQKERLGWLNSGVSPPITTVSTDGTYTIGTYESIGPGPKALKILKSIDPITGKRTWYYIESRQAIGFDGFLANNTNVLNGVLVRTGSESGGNTSYLLDMNPENDTLIWDWLVNAPLVVGQTFVDPDTGVTMTTDWVSGTGASVTVRFGAGGTSLTVATDQTSYTRNQSVSINATVRSGAAPIANVTVNFTVKKSNGSIVTGTAISGSNGIAVYKLRLTKKDPVGTYEALAATMTASAATNFMVK